METVAGIEQGYRFPQERTERISLGPVGYCIYCGTSSAESAQLTDEHIIADGLGGDVVLRKASCTECMRKIAKFEQRAMKSWFGGMREGLKIQSKKRRKGAPSSNNIQIWEPVDGIDSGSIIEQSNFQLSERSYSEFSEYSEKFLEHITTPGALIGELSNNEAIHSLFTAQKFSEGKEFAFTTTLHTDDYIRLLAKIGLCVARGFYQGGFEPYLNDIILNGNMAQAGYLI